MANVGEKPCEAPESLRSILKKGSKVDEECPTAEESIAQEAAISLKRKNTSEKASGVAVGASVESYASVVKNTDSEAVSTIHHAPSSAVLGNLSKANGKRLKLDIRNGEREQATDGSVIGPVLLHGEKVAVVRSKPPIPPKPEGIRGHAQQRSGATATPPRETAKGKKQQVTEAQTAQTVQKLLAQNEQMRLELSELRSSLAAERNAVRVLRAQNESDLRKTKTECKKLQEALQHQKRNSAAQCNNQAAPAGGVTPAKRTHRGPGQDGEPAGGMGTGQESLGFHGRLEVLKLNQEISALRETNKFLEDKYRISSEAERRKASDMSVMRDLHELRLTKLTKIARQEVQKLLEELRSKDRSLAQLKKELQAAQTAGATGGGCRKERKAAKNSAQQSHEMRKLRETEPCSGTISKSNSNNSIQSVNEDYEQLETKEALELTIVTATTTTTTAATDSPAPAVARAVQEVAGPDSRSGDYGDCRTTRNALAAQLEKEVVVELAVDTTTYGNDEAQRPALPYELCKRTMEAHSDDHRGGASSVVTESNRLRQPAVARERQPAQVSLPFRAGVLEVRSGGVGQARSGGEAEEDCHQPVSFEASDSDSALSSMSPQPNSFSGDSPDDDPWHVRGVGGGGGGDGPGEGSGKLERIKQELDEMQQRYQTLSRDYTAAKQQIDRLEQDLVKATQATREQTKLNERIGQLMQREEDLLKETHELREQNELLEFRIIELEESHDKWSLRSNSSPTVGGSTTKDGWTDTEKEHDELIMLSERSDSGVTSPNSHHHLEDQQSGVPSPCDLSLLDQIPTDDVRKRLIAMSKRACYDAEDKMCLLQILSLLNNLEALSQDHEIAGDDLSLPTELQAVPAHKYGYSLPESGCPPKASSTPYKTGAGRIVATVQPFHSGSSEGQQPATVAVAAVQPPPMKAPSIASIAETFGGMKKSTRWNNAGSLQESGVFVDEPCANASTQTELEDFPCPEKTNAELCAEIEKLNRFRAKIEECKGVAGVGAGAGAGAQGAGLCPTGGSMVALNLPAPTGDEACDRRRLQFYVERAVMLENKLKVYESSGEQQLRHLSERMQREVQLESWVKQLSEKIDRLELENERLEEERCELEEIENDTRLRLQRLEEDVEVMGQRNEELEVSRSSYQAKYQDAKETVLNLEELVHRYEEKIFLLEESENDLRERIEVIHMFIPVLVLFNSWQLHEQFKEYLDQIAHQQQRPPQQPQLQQFAIQCIPKDHIEYFESGSSAQAEDLQVRLSELMNREKELTQNIAELNRAYNETLENADNLWAQMEREYKEKIGRCEQEEATLKSKIAQLEERLSKDSEYASERIAHLEEAESGLKGRISRLGRENKELAAKHGALLEEYGTLKEDYAQLQHYLRGPAAEALEREKKRALALEDELAHAEQLLRDGEESHRAEVGTLRGRLLAATKELNHIEVTNSELREEVETLEARIRELMANRSADEERIRQLTEELEAKQSQIVALQQARRAASGASSSSRSSAGRSLAQELERPLKGGSYARHGYEVHSLNSRKFQDSDSSCSSSAGSSGSEDKQKFPFARQSAFETKEVKSLAETIILNAESRGVKTPKKSFVEEMN